MNLLLDTNVALRMAEEDLDSLPRAVRDAIAQVSGDILLSVASLWEIAIKHRLGKLPLPCPLDAWPQLFTSFGIRLLDVTPSHALTRTSPVPDTRDPFDRLLLAICAVEGVRLLTIDRALADHPLAWRTSTA